MVQRTFVLDGWLLVSALAAISGCASTPVARPPVPIHPPSIVFILADDLGYGELGSYGQQMIQTPRLDRMAAEGLRLTQFYAGSTVCAPSRAVLMTGQHTGRVRVRGNGGPKLQQLLPEDVTVAEVLRGAGYATALIGKWGLGEEDSPGHPLRQGFDHFYGYLNQVHAHNYYPEFLWRGWEREPLRNVVQPAVMEYSGGFVGGTATKRVDYAPDLFADEALRWIEAQRDRPFFLYLAVTPPHANNEATKMVGNGQEVPDFGRYAGEPWSDQLKGQAELITRLDRDVGRLLDHLDALGLAERTLVVFTSDNGPHTEGGMDPDFFRPAGPLRGRKRDLYEGGIRVPFIARWPGTVAPGVSDHVAYLGDVLATAAELAGAPVPPGVQSVSFAPLLRGDLARQGRHDHLYWEFYERGGAQAVRFGDWKAIRAGLGEGHIALYDLARDVGETTDLAAEHPELVARAAALMAEAHVPDPAWKVGGSRRPPPPPPVAAQP